MALCRIAGAAGVIGFEVESIQQRVLTGKPTGDVGLYALGAGVCVYRANKAVACGFVSETSQERLRIQLTHGSAKFAPREKLRANLVDRFGKSFDQVEARGG